MANFDLAYRRVHGNEGWYNPGVNDKGGETYAGIARNSHPNWAGWAVIDAYKAKKGPIARYFRIPDAALDRLVVDFYRVRWNVIRGNEIKSQAVATFFYDFHTNSGGATKVLQRLLNAQFGKELDVDGAFGKDTLAAVNSVDGATLHNALKKARTAYVNALVVADPSQAVHLPGWLARINGFPDEIKKPQPSQLS